MRHSIRELQELGPLPSSAEAVELVDTIDRFQSLLASIEHPVSTAEVRLLVRLFGPDDCYGLAWTLVHLIETAPADAELGGDPTNPWVQLLADRRAKG